MEAGALGRDYNEGDLLPGKANGDVALVHRGVEFFIIVYLLRVLGLH